MSLKQELGYFVQISSERDLRILFSTDVTAIDFERLGFIIYSLGLEDLQNDFFIRHCSKFRGVIDWEAELSERDIEKYVAWLQEFIDGIESEEERERVAQMICSP